MIVRTDKTKDEKLKMRQAVYMSRLREGRGSNTIKLVFSTMHIFRPFPRQASDNRQSHTPAYTCMHMALSLALAQLSTPSNSHTNTLTHLLI